MIFHQFFSIISRVMNNRGTMLLMYAQFCIDFWAAILAIDWTINGKPKRKRKIV